MRSLSHLLKTNEDRSRLEYVNTNNRSKCSPKEEKMNLLEAVSVSHFPDDGDHKELNWADVIERVAALPSREVVEAQGTAELILGRSARHVNFVAEDEERDIGQHLVTEKAVKLALDLRKALAVDRIDKEDDTVHLRVVVAPDLARGLMATQIERTEANVAHEDLLRRRHLRRDMQRHAVVTQDVHQRCLTRIVEAEEQDLRVLVVQACVRG